jgi:hypothetical protein
MEREQRMFSKEGNARPADAGLALQYSFQGLLGLG